MKPFLYLTALCILLLSHIALRAQEMDKELVDLATKLSAEISKQGKKKVTVLDFTDLQGGSTELGKYIAEELTVNLVMVKQDFAVLDRANLRKILAEHKLTAQGLVDPENAKKLGMFAGVDALVLGTIIPKTDKVSLTAKIITTDTAEIVGAARSEFTKSSTVEQLLSQPAKPEESQSLTASTSASAKPFGDLVARVESLKMLPNQDRRYSYLRTSLIISNTSPSKTYGVAIHKTLYEELKLINDRGEEFALMELTGVEVGALLENNTFDGSMTEILPRNSITVMASSRIHWSGNGGDYRPYRLQTMVYFGIEEKGQYPQIKKHNLVIDIK